MKFFISVIIIFTLFSCKKDFLLDKSAVLFIPKDTVTFDTVFTTLGSTTKYFKVFNTSNRAVIVSEIRIAGGEASNFRININGNPSAVVKDIEIAPNDSLYVFVAVTVDPNNQNNPFIITDSVIFTTNDKQQRVILNAWGQNANFYNGAEICNETWTNEKPYVIFNSALVDTNCTLTIQEGTKIYFHSGSGLYVSGILIINGTKENPVVIQGDRLEKDYSDIPGQWDGIYLLRGSTNNLINYGVIKNASSALILGFSRSPSLDGPAPYLKLSNTIIQNNLGSGIFSFASQVDCENTLVFNCGQNNILLTGGGSYNFTHCTLVDSNTNLYLKHEVPVLGISNYLEAGSAVYVGEMNANFTNCIISGVLDSSEVQIEKLENDNTPLNYLIDHCLVKVKPQQINTTNFIDCIFNANPLFEDADKDNYKPKTGSPVIDTGKPTPIITDIENNIRDATPDLGAYEKIN